VPGGEHATIFFETTKDEIAAPRTFERLFDGNINGTNPSSAVLRGGALVLDVTPASGGTVIPMELEHQHICGH
jgi:hypothetical protein